MFGGVVALDGVSLQIATGECHALVGENGAGKSTLGKLLAGIHRPDAGDVVVTGQAQSIRTPRDAARAGVGMVHQELAFCPDLSVAENLCLGRYPRRMGGLVHRGEMRRIAHERLAKVGRQAAALDVDRPIRSLNTAQEQLVQIASAVGSGARVLIFDEPTSSLSESEAQSLFTLIDDLRRQSITIIYISHRMPEIFRLADRISVLRDGRLVGTISRAEASEDRLIEMMIGRALGSASIRSHGCVDLLQTPAIRVESLSSPGRCASISFEVRPREIVGFSGLVGAGRSEMAQALFGLDRAATGIVAVNGKQIRVGNVRAMLRAGVGLVPEDRKRQGLILPMSGRRNFSLVILERFRRWGLLRHAREAEAAKGFFGRLAVKTPSIETPVANLSGGNQQKVVLAKWLACELRVLIVDEPTRGVDVGAKAAIHELLGELAANGLAIILISSELPEILRLSNRILVMRAGRIVGEIAGQHATQDALMRMMAGVE